MSNLLVHAMILLFCWAPFAALAAYEDRLTGDFFARGRRTVAHPFRAIRAYRMAHVHQAPAH